MTRHATAAAFLIGLALTATPAAAAFVADVEANDTLATAQNIDGFFSLEANAEIANSTTMAHATVIGAAHSSYDIYRFTVAAANTLAYFDIDHASHFDSVVSVFNAAGVQLAMNDDTPFSADPGSSFRIDSYLTYTFANAGQYYVRVSSHRLGAESSTGTYALHTSIQGHATGAVPEPGAWALMILGFGAAGASLRDSRRRAAA